MRKRVAEEAATTEGGAETAKAVEAVAGYSHQGAPGAARVAEEVPRGAISAAAATATAAAAAEWRAQVEEMVARAARAGWATTAVARAGLAMTVAERAAARVAAKVETGAWMAAARLAVV